MQRFKLPEGEGSYSNENVPATHGKNIRNEGHIDKNIANESQPEGRTVTNAGQPEGRTVADAGQADGRTVADAGQADGRTVADAGQADIIFSNVGQTDGRTVSNAGERFTDDIQLTDDLQSRSEVKKGFFGSANIQAEVLTPQINSSKDINKPVDDDAHPATQGSLSYTFDFWDDSFWKILDVVAESTMDEKLVPEMTQLKIVSEDSKLDGYITYPSISLRINFNEKLQNALSSSKETVRNLTKSKECKQLCIIEEPKEDTIGQIEAKTSELEVKSYDSILNLKNYETKKEGTKTDDTEKVPHSPRNVTNEKDYNKSTIEVAETGNSLQKVEDESEGQLNELENNTKLQITVTADEVEDESSEVSADLSEEESNKDLNKCVNDYESFVDDIMKNVQLLQKNSQLLKNFIEENVFCNKDGSSDDIQEEIISHHREPDNTLDESKIINLDDNKSTIEVAATGNSLQKVEDKSEGQLNEPENNTKLQITVTADELEEDSSEVSADLKTDESYVGGNKGINYESFNEKIKKDSQLLQSRIGEYIVCMKNRWRDDIQEDISLRNGIPDNTREKTLVISKEDMDPDKDVANFKKLKETRTSKEQRNYRILGLDGKVKIEKDFGSPLDCKKKPVRSSQKLTEEKKDKKNEVNEESDCDKNKLKSVEETQAWLKKLFLEKGHFIPNDQNKSSAKTKNKPEIGSELPNSDLDGKDKKPRDLESEIKSFRQERDYLSSEKEPVTSATKAEVHKTKSAAEFKDENNAIIAASAKHFIPNDQNKSPRKTKNKPEFVGELPNSDLDANDKKPRNLESEIKSFRQERDYLSSEKEPVISATKAKVHETRIAAEFESENNAIIAIFKKQKHTFAGLKKG